MKTKIIFSTILFVAVLIFSFFVLLQEKSNNQNQVSINRPENQPANQIILFYGEGCPHCAVVEEYIKSNNIKEKIAFEEKEVYHNKKNADELVEKAKMCGIPTDYVGVPFLWDGLKCYLGDRDIIEFFNQKINEK